MYIFFMNFRIYYICYWNINILIFFQFNFDLYKFDKKLCYFCFLVKLGKWKRNQKDFGEIFLVFKI